MTDSTRLRTYEGEIKQSKPGIALDETALQAAGQKVCKQILWLQDAEGEQRAKELARSAISTYLQKAAFEVEVEDRRIEFGNDAHQQRLVGPWVPVVQAESEEE